MKYTTIPKTDITVSTICLGTWVFGGDMWGGAKQEESIGAVSAAIDSGINFIDTAPIYGFGKSEEIVGKAISGKRDKVILATKCGLIKKGKGITTNLSPKSIQKEIGASLKRLNVQYIDLYQCHWPDPQTPIEKTIDTLRQIRQQGKIRYIGVSNFEWGLTHKANQYNDIVTNQVQYSLLERAIENELLPECYKNDVGIITYGALAGGILTGKYRTPTHFDSRDARGFLYKYYTGESFRRTQAVIATMKDINRPANQIAINWVRKQAGVTSVIVGCRNANQVAGNAQAADWELSKEEIDKLGTATLKL